MYNNKNKARLKILNKFIEENIDNNKNYVWKKGYSTLGILLVGFCNWIYNSNKSCKIDKIFFLSREGYLIKKAYEIIYPKEKTGYLYISRKSLSLPSMKKCKNVQEKIDYLILPPMFTVDILLTTLGLDFNNFTKELKEVNIEKDEKFYRNTFKKDKRIISLLNKLNKEITENINNQFENFLKYLKQEEFKGNVGVVDIGWHNSIQKSLLNIAEDTKIKGYYLGVYKDGFVFKNGNEANGYLYNYGDKIKEQYKTFSFVSLFESMFLAHEGTTRSYQEKDGKIIPQLADYEYKNENESLELIKEFQDGAIRFVEDFININNNIELNSELCSFNILKFGSKPSKKDIEIFGKISFENYQKHNIVNFNKSSFYYFFHFNTMKEDFYKSGWRIVFLKKLFKLPLPYVRFIEILCNLFKN